MIKKTVFFVLLFGFFLVSILTIFHRSFSIFFFQDDYFLFSISRISTFNDLMKIFIPRTDAIYYRPISLQLFYYIFHLFFRLNIFYYHIFQFLLHALNGALVYILVSKLTRNRPTAFLSAFFFVVSWTHIYELTWIASTFNSIGLFFSLIYLIFYFKNASKITYLSEISLIFALLSVEVAAILPFLLILILIFFHKIKNSDRVRIFAHLLFALFYIFFRFILFKIPTTGSYQMGISPQTIKNFVIYLLWLINFPEASIIHLKLDLSHLIIFDQWFVERFTGFSILLMLSMFFYLLYFTVANISILKKSIKLYFFCLLWFFISLLPFIVIPKRSYPYYLLISQIGFWIFFSHVLISSKYKILSVLCFLIFFATNLSAVRFNNNNHWLYMTSFHAESYYKKYLTVAPILNNKKYIFWKIDEPFARNALVDGLAFNVFSNNYEQRYFLTPGSIPKKLRLATFNLH